jgi:outer membrane lipoprotein-sorting protein
VLPIRLSSCTKTAILLLILLCCSACATVQKPLTGIVAGREVETLQSSIAISMKSGEHGSSGRGFLIFKYPDRFHMAILSPFGLTVLEVFSDGQQLTCLVPSRQIAYRGLIAELPETGGRRTFGMLKWVVARTPPRDPSSSAKEVVTPAGDRIYYDKYDLVQRKVSPEGDQVRYSGYQNVSGVAFPENLEIKNSYGDSVRITFDEPEINTPVENSALTPNLEGFSVLPLAEFKGF